MCGINQSCAATAPSRAISEIVVFLFRYLANVNPKPVV
jgi:hypothetical protein